MTANVANLDTQMVQVAPQWQVNPFSHFTFLHTQVTPLQFSFIVFVFLSLGLIIRDAASSPSVPPLKCAVRQSAPEFMSQDIITNLGQYKVQYGIIIHNRSQDTFKEHATAYIEWISRHDKNLKANIHIHPSTDMYNNGIIENALLNNLPRSMIMNNKELLTKQITENWNVSSVLKLINREDGQTLEFYIRHLFRDRLSSNWWLDSTDLNPSIIDLRGYVISKINDYTVNLNSYINFPIDINYLPPALEHFIDVINDTWLPIML